MSLLDDTCILVKPRALFFHGDHGEATRGEASRALGAIAAEDPWANGNGLKPREKMGKATYKWWINHRYMKVSVGKSCLDGGEVIMFDIGK